MEPDKSSHFRDRVPTVTATGAQTQPRWSAVERAAQQLRQEILECGRLRA